MLVLLLGACAQTGGDKASDCESGEPRAWMGTGEYAWEDLAPGDPITMVHGPQGGWHILGSVRLESLYDNVEVHYTITDVASGEIVSDNEYFVQQVPLDDCEGEVIGRYGYLNHYDDLVEGEADTPWELFACHDMTLAMAIHDPTWDKSVAASIDVMAVPDPQDSTVPCP